MSPEASRHGILSAASRISSLASYWIAQTLGAASVARQGGAAAREVLPPTRRISLRCWSRRTRGRAVKTEREKAEEKRQAKLEAIREQVDAGTLVIRAMTDEERQQYPPRPVERKRSDRR